MKKIKVTKEQYNKLLKAGLIKESTNVVDKEFSKALAGKNVRDLKYIPEEKIELGSKFNIKKPIAGLKNMTEAVNNLLEYIYGLNENFSTFLENYDLTYEDICETLESKGYLVKKEGSYKVSKKMGDAATVKEGIAQTISEMIKPIDEDYPAGAAYDSSAPYNRPEPEIRRGERASKKFVDLKYSNPEIAIFRDENSGEMYVFYYGDVDQKVFEPYAERQGFIDPDGDIEYYDDFDVDDDTLENYVNDNFPKLTKGVGPEDFESGQTDLVLIDEHLKDDLLHLYDKDSRLVMVLEPIAEGIEITPNKDDAGEYLKYLTAKEKRNREKEKTPDQLELDLDLDEITGAASSGAYTGLFSPSNKEVKKYDEKKLPPVVTEMESADAGNFAYDNPGFVGISRDGKFPTNPKKTKAQKNTQWAGGAFVEMDDCTKLNNNKEAQKGKCSTGAVDNVVKLRKTKSNINAPSLSEGRIMREALKLQHDKKENRLIVISDLEGRAANQETFTNKNILKQNGFIWTGTNWAIPVDKLEIAKNTLSLINKAEYLIDKLEDLEAAVEESSADNKSLLKSRLDQYITDLANATDEVTLSAEIRRFLTFFAKFHNYSFYNRMLIFIQKPDATRVASYKTWQSNFRQVNKGAKAITVLAPIISKSPKDGEEDDENLSTSSDVRGYRAVNVFDISDTKAIDERGEVPETPKWWGDNTPSETADMLFDALKEVASDMGITISQSDAKGGEKGYSAGDHINISSDVVGAGRLSTAIHEMAHELMHWRKSSIYYIDNGSGKQQRELQELQAESVSYTVLKHYGIPVSHHATYLALWKANKDRIMNNLEIISKVSQFIINKIDAQIADGK